MLCNVGDTVAAVAAASMLTFSAGGHVNHCLFWQNLAPKGMTGEPSGESVVLYFYRNVWLEHPVMFSTVQSVLDFMLFKPTSKNRIII